MSCHTVSSRMPRTGFYLRNVLSTQSTWIAGQHMHGVAHFGRRTPALAHTAIWKRTCHAFCMISKLDWILGHRGIMFRSTQEEPCPGNMSQRVLLWLSTSNIPPTGQGILGAKGMCPSGIQLPLPTLTKCLQATLEASADHIPSQSFGKQTALLAWKSLAEG